jgi:hypothetical protein
MRVFLRRKIFKDLIHPLPTHPKMYILFAYHFLQQQYKSRHISIKYYYFFSIHQPRPIFSLFSRSHHTMGSTERKIHI